MAPESVRVDLRYLSLRPTNARIWHKAVFKVGLFAGPKPTRVRQGQKYLRTRRHSPLWGASGARQYPPKGVKAWGDGPLRRRPQNVRRLKPFSYGRKGTPPLSRHVNRKFFYKKWPQKVSTSIARFRLAKSITSIFIELFLAEVFFKCWSMLIFPFCSCNGQLESKKGLFNSGRARMLFL